MVKNQYVNSKIQSNLFATIKHILPNK